VWLCCDETKLVPPAVLQWPAGSAPGLSLGF
jgi:hypothetical protein